MRNFQFLNLLLIALPYILCVRAMQKESVPFNVTKVFFSGVRTLTVMKLPVYWGIYFLSKKEEFIASILQMLTVWLYLTEYYIEKILVLRILNPLEEAFIFTLIIILVNIVFSAIATLAIKKYKDGQSMNRGR